MSQIRKKHNISDETLRKWRDQGVLCERTIDDHLRRRSLRALARKRAAENGVSPAAWRMRIWHGASLANSILPSEQYKALPTRD
jgi:hypothetical protein